MILEKKIGDISALMYELNYLPNNFVFRGQSDSRWKLTSSLERVLGKQWSAEKARKFESYSLDIFRSKYHIYSGNEHMPRSKLSWLSVMQHYGVPTRLIDFTTSPFIALYFALEDYDALSGANFSIFAIDYSSLMECSIEYIKSKDNRFNETRESIYRKQDDVFDEVVDRYSYDIAWITEPIELNARIDRQAGTFLVSGNLGRAIESIIDLPAYDDVSVIKFDIQASLYEGVYVALRKMSINSKSIYGDLAGLAKSIKMELRPYA